MLVRKYVDTARALGFLFSCLLGTVLIQCTAIALLIATNEALTVSWDDPFCSLFVEVRAFAISHRDTNVSNLRPSLILWSPTVPLSVINILQSLGKQFC